MEHVQRLQLAPQLLQFQISVRQSLPENPRLLFQLAHTDLRTSKVLGRLVFNVLFELADAVLRRGPHVADVLVLVHADPGGPSAHRPRRRVGARPQALLRVAALVRDGQARFSQPLAQPDQLRARLPLDLLLLPPDLLQLAQALAFDLGRLPAPLGLALDVLPGLLPDVVVQLLHPRPAAEGLLGRGPSRRRPRSLMRPRPGRGQARRRGARQAAETRCAARGAFHRADAQALGEFGHRVLEGLALVADSRAVRRQKLHPLDHLCHALLVLLVRLELRRLDLLLVVPIGLGGGGNVIVCPHLQRLRQHAALTPQF
mmetsp:Transcript_42573/g.128650  ORF Transcript_42573/g.128650 Transcript_42573/m.128650 type:complete len:315 (-) Transcript_42573:291-1235(-)